MYRRYQSGTLGEDGLACLAAAAEALGERWDYRELRRKFRISNRGLTTDQLLAVAKEMNLQGTPKPLDVDPKGVTRPTIVAWTHGRYVLLVPSRSRRPKIFDPSSGWRSSTTSEIADNASGEMIELSLATPPERHSTFETVRIAKLLRWHPQIRGVLAHVLVMSLFLQAYVVLSPLYLKFLIDDVIARGDNGLLVAAALGFGLLAVFNTVASVLKDIALQTLNNQLSWDMTNRVFGRLLNLPLQWFQGRVFADTLGRLHDVERVRAALSALTGALFDALLAATSLIALWLMSPMILGVAVAGIAFMLLLRIFTIPMGLDLGSQAVVAGVAEQTKRMEAVRAIQTVKALRSEEVIESDWRQHLRRSLKANRRSMIFGTLVGGSLGLVGSAMTIVAIYLGALSIIAGGFTVGMLTAALAYLGQFSQSSNSLFQQLMAWRMSAVQLDRIGDIVLEPEQQARIEEKSNLPKAPFEPASLKVEGLTFRYAPQEPAHLQELHLDVRPGEHVAIVGPSGGGKSTLLKILAGLYRPDGGRVAINGKDIECFGAEEFRRTVGMVMQEDHLLTGTVSENVALFVPEPDRGRIWETLEAVGIDEEVRLLARGIDTPVGDMGASLSGGQRQRLLLARAIFRRPALLLLDEATSHLDPVSEAKVIGTLRDLRMTRITVAHRANVAEAADRVVRLRAGRLVPEPK